jgi:glycerol-3-phosphate acyltransferase PlsY
MIFRLFLSVCIGYLLGSLNASLFVSKFFYKNDIRDCGSGNAGATNMLRSFGKGAAAVVFAADFLKGILACLVGSLITGYIENYGWVGMYLAGFAAVVGHNWPVFFKFKGGKGVLTTFAVILYISPIPALICFGIFILVVALTRYVSLGSLIAAISWPVVSLLFDLPVTMLVLAVFMVILIIVRHKGNITRLFNGTEKRLSIKKNNSL